MTRLALHILFFLSGAAALGYQLVWAKMFSTGLGHEMPAVLAIIAAFMAGMALGARALDRFIPRDARAGHWLAGLELSIGVWALLASWFIPSVNDLALRFIGLAPGAFQHWLIAFTIPAAALLPATMAMGATLPAMEKFLSVVAPRHESIGSVYAANTFGAFAGTLLAPFVLMPALGFNESGRVLAVMNGLAAMGAFLLARRQREFSASPERRMKERPSSPLSLQRITFTLFITGLLGITYETVGVRVLSQVLEGTVFTYAAVLAIFLLGTAAGAAAFHRWWRESNPRRTVPALLYSAGMACALGLFIMMLSGWIYRASRRMGDGPVEVFAAEMLTAAAIFLLPAFFMGAVFSQFTHLARAVRGSIGRVVAANTVGAALAPVLVVALLPAMGTKWLLLATALGYFLVSQPMRPPAIWLVPFLLTLAAGNSARLQLIDVPPGGKIISYQEGVMASVAVLADTNDQRTLRVDNRYQMGGTAAADAEYRQAHLPLLLHPNPQRALLLGVGTGISLGAASLYPELKADAVELVPEVVDAMSFFESKNFSAARLPDFKLHTADARRFVRATDTRYDVIIADLFHPYRDGAGALYTREHFTAIRERLATNGLFCQWLPLHQLDEPTLRVIVRTFQSVFPNSDAWLLRFNVEVPVVALVGHGESLSWQTNLVESRLDETRLAGELKRLALTDSLRLHGHWLAGREELSIFASRTPINTDDDQRVTFMAPRQAYQHDSKPYASLQALLAVAERSVGIARELTDGRGSGEYAQRLARYINARNVYLHGLIHDAEQRRDEAVDAYIESARSSADFTSGYAQCITIASVIAASNPARAKNILERLMEAQPERPVARQMLERMFPK